MRIQDALPSRGVRNRRVTPLSARREMQRRAAVAVLSLVVVVGGLGAAVFVLGGQGAVRDGDRDARDGPGPAERRPRSTSTGSSARASTSSSTTRALAEELLTEAFTAIDAAAASGHPRDDGRPVRDPDRRRASTGCTGWPTSAAATLFTFPESATTDLQAHRPGPGRRPLRPRPGHRDASTGSTSRTARPSVDLPRGQHGRRAASEGAPKLMAVGGARSRSSSMTGTSSGAGGRPTAPAQGTLDRDPSGVTGSAEWGDDVLAIGTFLRDPEREPLQLLRRRPVRAADPALLAGRGRRRLPGSARRSGSRRRATSAASPRCTSTATSGSPTPASVLRVADGNSDGWEAETPGRRGPPDRARRTRLVNSGAARREGTIYAFDAANDRLIALSRSTAPSSGSTAWRRARTRGRTCATSTWSRASRASPTRSSGSARTPSTGRSWNP